MSLPRKKLMCPRNGRPTGRPRVSTNGSLDTVRLKPALDNGSLMGARGSVLLECLKQELRRLTARVLTTRRSRSIGCLPGLNAVGFQVGDLDEPGEVILDEVFRQFGGGQGGLDAKRRNPVGE